NIRKLPLLLRLEADLLFYGKREPLPDGRGNFCRIVTEAGLQVGGEGWWLLPKQFVQIKRVQSLLFCPGLEVKQLAVFFRTRPSIPMQAEGGAAPRGGTGRA